MIWGGTQHANNDDDHPARGCRLRRLAEVLVDPANKQDVIVLHRFPTLEQAQAFAGSDELREAMTRAGVAGAPRIELAVDA